LVELLLYIIYVQLQAIDVVVVPAVKSISDKTNYVASLYSVSICAASVAICIDLLRIVIVFDFDINT